MDENKNEKGLYGQPSEGEMPTAPQELPAETPVSPETPVFPEETVPAADDGADAPAPERPKKSPAALIAVVIAVLVIAAVAAFASGVFGSPEKAVAKAFDATEKDMKQYAGQLTNELPALKVLQNVEPRSTSTDFDITFESLDAGAAQAQIGPIVDMLAGSGLRGTIVSDAETPAVELDASVHMGDLDLFDLYGFLSPELLAGGMPTFTDTILSVNPKTFAEDMKGSPLYDGMDEADLRELQSMITAETKAITGMSSLNVKKMQQELIDIMKGIDDNAAYAKGPKEDGLKTYVMTIPGADVKKTVVSLVKYIYVDSEIATVYNDTFTAMPSEFEGKSFSDMMQEEIIAPIEQGMPETEMTVTLKIGKGNLIKAAHVEVAPPEASEDAAFKVTSMTADYTIADDRGENITINLEAEKNGSPVKMRMTVADAYKDGNYDVNVNLDINSDAMKMRLIYEIFADKNGAFNLDVKAEIPDVFAPGMGISYTIGGNGTIRTEGEQTVCDYPDLHLNMGVMDQEIKLGFAAKATSTPITAPYAFPKQATPLFSMSETELTAELGKYEAGFSALQDTIMQAMFGLSGGAAAEPAPAPAA